MYYRLKLNNLGILTLVYFDESLLNKSERNTCDSEHALHKRFD